MTVSTEERQHLPSHGPLTEWTAALIYNEGVPETQIFDFPCIDSLDDLRFRPGAHIYRPFREEFLAAVLAETSWKPLEAERRLDDDVTEAVGTRKMSCPLCHGRRSYSIPYRGEVTGVIINRPENCCCSVYTAFWSVWGNPTKVPARFKDAGVEKPKPHTALSLSAGRQQAIIDASWDNPDLSYFLYGPPNTGKTFIFTTLFRQAVGRWAVQSFLSRDLAPFVWRATANTLLDEHMAMARRGPEDRFVPPSVTIAAIRGAIRLGLRPCLYLDEIDKINPTPQKLVKLVEIVGLIYDAGGQVVATSNKSEEQLAEKWGDDEAGTVIRRIGGDADGRTIYFAESSS